MKKEILETLKKNSEIFVSGEELSNKIGVTRAAVWKHIKQMKEEGYEIEAVSRKGYRLTGEPDILDAKSLEIELNCQSLTKKVIHYDNIDSTNTQAKILASRGACEGTVLLAEEQTGGRGRLGRHWIAPKGTGIWMSIILKPDIEPSEAAKITQIAAAAATMAVREITGCEAGIKWPNDIIVKGKKICGILTEMSGELNSISYIVVGIGINVNMGMEDFPYELREKATSLKECSGKIVSRKKLVISVLTHFEKYYFNFLESKNVRSSVDICKKYSVTLGKQVKIMQRGMEMLGEALDITEDGELMIKNDKGEIEKIVSGEVSVRGINGYI